MKVRRAHLSVGWHPSKDPQMRVQQAPAHGPREHDILKHLCVIVYSWKEARKRRSACVIAMMKITPCFSGWNCSLACEGIHKV